MRFLCALLLVATTTLAGCGGGSSDTVVISNASVNNSGDQLTLSSFSATFNGRQGSSEPSPQFVAVNWAKDIPIYIRTWQTGPMFSQTFAENVSALAHNSGWITIQPAAPTDVGSFSGTITVAACVLE